MSLFEVIAEICYYLYEVFNDLASSQSGNPQPAQPTQSVAQNVSQETVSQNASHAHDFQSGLQVAESVVSEVAKVASPVERALLNRVLRGGKQVVTMAANTYASTIFRVLAAFVRHPVVRAVAQHAANEAISELLRQVKRGRTGRRSRGTNVLQESR